MRKVRGLMNGLVFCRLCVEICLTEHNDPTATQNVETASYMLPDSFEMMSGKDTKRLFCDLFGKKIELSINDLERITNIDLLTEAS